MLIILEGPDCAGKTTIAEMLVKQLKLRDPGCDVILLHRGPPGDRHPLDEYVMPLLAYRPGQHLHVICDRWHLGEWVYPAVLHRETQMDLAVFRWIELFLLSRGASTVVINPMPGILQTRMDKRGDEMIDREQLVALHKRYVYADRMSLTGYTNSMPSVDDIIAAAVGAESRAISPRTYTTLIGSPAPETLILGDVRNCVGNICTHATRHSPLGPAFMPYPATSGQYLMRAVTKVRNVAYANACDVDDVSKMWLDLGQPHVVALGVRAAKKLANAGIMHAAVPHPQFIRRFHYGGMRPYGKLINELMGTGRNELSWRPQELSELPPDSMLTSQR